VVNVPGGGAVVVALDVEVTNEALPAGRRSTRVPVTVRTTTGAGTSEDAAEIYVLPSLTAPRVATSPAIDGDLADVVLSRGIAEMTPATMPTCPRSSSWAGTRVPPVGACHDEMVVATSRPKT
jgi:hypothetical protein